MPEHKALRSASYESFYVKSRCNVKNFNTILTKGNKT